MSLGVFFALSHDDATKLRAFEDEQDRLKHVINELESRYWEEGKTYVAECDKAWDAMHRALADGLLTWDGGTYPLNHTVLGGERLYAGDDYVLILKTPKQVREVSTALEALSEEAFRNRYDSIDDASYEGEKDDEDFAYTWDWFQDVRNLFQKAAQEGRHILFTADQ